MGVVGDWAVSSREARARVKSALVNYEFVQTSATELALRSAIAEWDKILDRWTDDFQSLVELRSERPLAELTGD
jgi:hypothetical protein